MFEENLVSHRFINIRVKRLQTWAQLFKARLSYRNFRTFTRMANYPQRSIFVIRGKKVQQITRTGLLPALAYYPHPETRENHATVLSGKQLTNLER